jgi:hypothetical protein
MSDTDFFVVWNPNGNNPRFRHASLDGAKAEAKCLAAATPGADFYVLHALSVSRVKDPVETVDLTDLPF